MSDLSIIIPVYNGEQYIDECLNNFIGEPVKVIVVDDGSIDNTRNILKNYLKYGNMKIIFNEHGGVSKARNTGLKYVDTPYFAFVDCDDNVLLYKYFEMINKMKEYNQKIGCSRLILNMGGFPFYGRKRKEGVQVFNEVGSLSSLPSVMTDKIFHSDLLPNVFQNEKLTVYEDADVSYHTLAKEGSVYFSNDPHYVYMMHAGSLVTTTLKPSEVKSISQIYTLVESLKSKFKKDNLYNKYASDITAIAIMLYYQRIRAIYFKKHPYDKEKLASCILTLLQIIDANYKSNSILLNNFKNNEYHDRLNVMLANLMINKHKIKSLETTSALEVFNTYDDVVKNTLKTNEVIRCLEKKMF